MIASRGVIRRLTLGFVNLLVLATVVTGAAGAAFLTVRGWLQPEGPEPSLPALLVLGAAAGSLVLIARRGEPQSHGPAALLLAGIVLSRIVYTVAVHEPRFSDFAIMWDYAASLATGPFRYPGGPGDFQAMSEVRALPFLAPVAMLSGGRPIGYQLANAIGIGLTALLAYGLTCAVASRKAGLIALWLIAIAPEPLMAAEIPTHDIPGTLFALVALCLVFLIFRWSQQGDRRNGALLGIGVVLGLVLWVADLQRGTGPFLLAAIVATAVVLRVTGTARRWGWVLAATVVLPAVITSILNRTVLPLVAGPVATQENPSGKWRWIAVHGNSESTGYWDLEGLFTVLLPLNHQEARTFALARTTSDVVDAGAARVRNYVKRIATLNRLGSQYHWYLDDSVDGRRWIATTLLDQRTGERLSSFLRSYSEGFRLGFLLLAVVAVTGTLLFGRPDPRLYLPLLTLAVLTLLLGLLGEAQPRYLFPAWFLLPICIGWFLTRGLGADWQPREAGKRALDIGIAAGIAGAAIGVGVLVVRLGLEAGWPRLIPTETQTYTGAAIAGGRYRTLLTEAAPASAIAHLSEGGRVTAYVARALNARLPCSREIRLTVSDLPLGGGAGRIDSVSKAIVLKAELPPGSGGTTRVAVHAAAPSDGAACPVLLWLLQEGQ